LHKQERTRLVNEAVLQMQRICQEVRSSRLVLLADIRSEIIPAVLQFADNGHLYGLFSGWQDKEEYTYRHSIAVGVLSGLLGTWLGYSRPDVLKLITAALLHDIGKMLVPEHILNKPEKLTDHELRVMRHHTVLGYELLKETVGISHRQALVALQHHERLDGSGYPLGIGQDKIDEFSRIVAIADVFHGMISSKVYKDAAPFHEALVELEREAYNALDPTMTRVFINKFMSTLIGHSVKLTDGREGKIVLIQPMDPLRPLLQVGEQFIDLSKDFSLNISRIQV